MSHGGFVVLKPTAVKPTTLVDCKEKNTSNLCIVTSVVLVNPKIKNAHSSAFVPVSSSKFTELHTYSNVKMGQIFGSSVSNLKFYQILSLQVVFIKMEKDGIARFKFCKSSSVFGIKEIEVLQTEGWDKLLKELGLKISNRSIKNPVGCIYEILNMCGFKCMNSRFPGKQDKTKKKWLLQMNYHFNDSIFQKNKHRVSCLRRGNRIEEI